jgi:hypothetical protein
MGILVGSWRGFVRRSARDAHRRFQGLRVSISLTFLSFTHLTFCCCSIVEFTSQEDAQRSIRELSEMTLLGRPVFIREVGFLNSQGYAH